MTGLGNKIMTMSEFERLLDVYGSDRTRWPAEARAGAGHLVGRDPVARHLLLEAEALDRLLERAPLPSLASEAALAERIVAAAQRSPRMVVAGAGKEVAALARPRPDRGPEQAAVRLSIAQWQALGRSQFGRAASLLAACLALGVLVGASSLPQPVLPALEEMTGITIGNGSYMTTSIDLLDEDLL